MAVHTRVLRRVSATFTRLCAALLPSMAFTLLILLTPPAPALPSAGGNPSAARSVKGGGGRIAAGQSHPVAMPVEEALHACDSSMRVSATSTPAAMSAQGLREIANGKRLVSASSSAVVSSTDQGMVEAWCRPVMGFIRRSAGVGGVGGTTNNNNTKVVDSEQQRDQGQQVGSGDDDGNDDSNTADDDGRDGSGRDTGWCTDLTQLSGGQRTLVSGGVAAFTPLLHSDPTCLVLAAVLTEKRVC